MVHKKRQSKRLTLKKKYFIERKVREHNRKVKRDAKKNPNKRKGLKKDPGVPNLYPFKQQFVDKMERLKEKEEQDVERQKEARAKEIERKRQMNIQEMREAAKKREEAFNERERKNKLGKGNLDLGDESRKAYYREFKKVTAAADVILEVLDARDPMGCRCPEVEQAILSQDPNKKIVLILNKIDLVPGENVEKWLKYLRAEYPTLAFKCSTQKQKRNIGHSAMSTSTAVTSGDLHISECLGADTLLQLLKNYCRNMGIKTSITVGIIGYPNVGKSSLINSLKRSRAVGVGSTPGFTKTLQEIHLDKHVKLLDCPGIVFSAHPSNADLILRNCVKLEKLDDPMLAVDAILQKCRKEQLISMYNLPMFNDGREFLAHLAAKYGKLGRGGIPDYNAAARRLLQDWNNGKIRFFTEPPVRKGVHVSASIVTNWAKEMSLDDVMSMENTNIISTLKPMAHPEEYVSLGTTSHMPVDSAFVASVKSRGGITRTNDDMMKDETDTPAYSVEKDKQKSASDKSLAQKQKQKTWDAEDELNPIKPTRMRLKQLKKQKKKAAKKASENMSDEEDSEEEDKDAYSFARHFVPNLGAQLHEDDDDDDDDSDEEEEEDGQYGSTTNGRMLDDEDVELDDVDAL